MLQEAYAVLDIRQLTDLSSQRDNNDCHIGGGSVQTMPCDFYPHIGPP